MMLQYLTTHKESTKKKKLYKNSRFQMYQDGSIGRSWTHILPWTQEIYNYKWNNSLKKRPENWMNTASITKCKRTAARWVGEAVMVSPLKNRTPYHSDSLWEESQRYRSFPQGARDSGSTSDIQTPRSRTGETKLRNTWLWKPRRNMSRKTIELQGTENPLLKGLRADSRDPKTSAKILD